MSVVRPNKPETLTLTEGHVLTVVAAATCTGKLWHLAAHPGDPSLDVTSISESSTTKVGPFVTPRRFRVECTAGELSFSTGLEEPTPITAASLGITAADVAVVDGDENYTAVVDGDENYTGETVEEVLAEIASA